MSAPCLAMVLSRSSNAFFLMSFISFYFNLIDKSAQLSLSLCSLMVHEGLTLKVDLVEAAIATLGQTLKKLHEHDSVSAGIAVAYTSQVLEKL